MYKEKNKRILFFFFFDGKIRGIREKGEGEKPEFR